MKKIFMFVATASLFMASCGDDDSDSTITPDSTVLVKKTIETDSYDNSVTTSLISYDGNKVTGTVYSDGSHDTFTYANNHLSKIQTYTGTTLSEEDIFTYNADGKLAVHVYLSYEDSYGEKTTFAYNTNGTITTQDFSGDLDTQTDLDGTGVVTLVNGNITQYAFTWDDSGTETSTFTFDDKNSPFKNVYDIDVITLAALEGGTNNILTSSSDGMSNYDTTYTYNAANYVTKSVEDQGGDNYTTEYFYE